jgi:hypothetical protein
MFIPRIGMEVVVDFLEGDPDAPLITGSVYNGVNTVPYALPRHSDISTLKSNSTKGGKGHNELRFVDRKGQEQLMLHAQNRMDICVGGNFCETNGGQRDLRVGKDFNLLNKGDLNWTAQSGWYQLVAKDLDLTVQANVHHDFQADLIEKVTGLAEMNPDTLSLVAANLINFKGKEMRAEYAADATLRGGTIVLEGSDGGLTFKCGGSFITIDQSGICISAPVVQINSGGAPKESTPANPAGPLVMEEPLEPTDCQCSTPGENLGGGGGGGGGSRQRRKKSLPGNNPPDWVPPKPPKPPVVPPPPAPAKPCSIQTLDIACAHNARKPDPGTRILQVVPDQGASSSGVSYGIESIKLKFSGNKSSGGTDTIKISGVAVDGGTAPIKTAVSRTPSPPAAGDFSGGASQDLKIVSPACDAWWPYPFKPEVYCIYGKGCDDAQLAWTVEAYPSLNYAGGLELSKFEELFKKLFGKDELSTQQKYGVTAGIKFAGPSGSMEAAWGWTENEDWRACFKVGLKAAVTFASVDGTARANLRDLLTAGALTFAGVPFNSSIKVFDALSEVKIGETAILDILSCMTLQLGLKLSIGLECAIAKKFFPDGTQEGDRGATLSGVGTIHADLLWRTGPPEVINASVKGTGEGPFEASGALSIESDGLHMKPKIAFKGLTIKIELEFNFFRVNAKQQLLNWTVLEARDLWPDPSDPAPPDWRLLPP